MGLLGASAEAQEQPDVAPPACALGADRDGDGLSDQCELHLAVAFAPEFVVSDRACNWSGTRLEGGYLFGADWNGPERVRIAYLPAYRLDCGWSGAKCWVRLAGGCRGHAGDSEFVAVDVRASSNGWEVEGVFMSAHCFGDDGCRWYRDEELGGIEWVRASFTSGPVIWVAEGKNANYPSESACDGGHYFYDTCDGNGPRYTFPVHDSRNIGSLGSPIGGDGCVTLKAVSADGSVDTDSIGGGNSEGLDATQITAPAASECFWSDVPFRGWMDEAESGVTPYVRYLTAVAGWGPNRP